MRKSFGFDSFAIYVHLWSSLFARFAVANDTHTYFRIKSHHEDAGGQWCLTRKNSLEYAGVAVDRCSYQNNLQLWRVDRRGQMRSYNNDAFCMRNVQKKNKLSMNQCIPQDKPLGFSFIFDPMNNSLIWLKSQADFMQYGLRAIAILQYPNDSDSNSKKVYLKARSNDILMKWHIEEDQEVPV